MKKLIKSFSFLFLLFVFIGNVSAASGTFSSGGDSIYTGRSTDITISLSTSDKIVSLGGTVGVSDSSCIRINSVSGLLASTNGNKFAYVSNDMTPVRSGTGIVRVNITGLKPCSAKLTISGATISTDSSESGAGVSMGTINVSEPPSTNNNLDTLSVSHGGLNPGFSASTTNYSVNVDTDVTSISVFATPSDSGARVEGAGSHSLDYGNNTIYVKVIAPSGDAKTYTITVNRKDNRSGNNNLSSLSIEGGTLNEGFDTYNTSYTGKIPFEYENANIKAIASDSKASVHVSGNYGIASEETRNVSVTVTAENGSSKTYNIAVTRGKDPNKKLSKDNYLTSITPSIGILSPVFNKEKTNYVIYLPYEVDSITFNVTLSDTKYGILTTDIPKTLMPGVSNVFKYTVKAEDESERTYTIVVKRAVNPDSESSSNTYLKNIDLINGTLLYQNGKKVTDFNKEIKRYFYKKGTAFNYKVETEDENATVITLEDGSSIQFIVEAPNGEFSIYTLDLYGRYSNIFRYIIVFIIGVITGILGYKGFKTIYPKIKERKPKERVKKEKTKKKSK